MIDVFLSYASEDIGFAKAVASGLQEHGWSTFWDRTIPTGQTWRSMIGQALSEARCVVVRWSASSVESTWVQEEADEGQSRGVLIPVLIAPVRPPIGFRSLQAANLNGWNGASEAADFRNLISDINSVIGPPTSQIHGVQIEYTAEGLRADRPQSTFRRETSSRQRSARNSHPNIGQPELEQNSAQKFIDRLGQALAPGFIIVAGISLVVNLSLIGSGVITESVAGRVIQPAIFFIWAFTICALAVGALFLSGHSLGKHVFKAIGIAILSGSLASLILYVVLIVE